MESNNITPVERFTYPEMIRALTVLGGVKEPTLAAWIRRGTAYGVSKSGPGSGGRRTYTALAILSLAIMQRLNERGFDPATLARLVVPDIWRRIADPATPVDYIWLVESVDQNGPIYYTVLSNTAEIKLQGGAPIVSKYDLAEDLERVLAELYRIRSERPADSMLPQVGFVPPKPQTVYEFYHARVN